ncbi:MAG: matrixin family metalloprotease [Gemmatimonadaceae bacterium]
MRRPSPPILALCLAALATGAALLPEAVRAAHGDDLRTSTAAAMMADEPTSPIRTVLDGLRSIRSTTIGGGTDATDAVTGVRGAIPAASVEIVARAAELSVATAATAAWADDATARLLEDEGPGTYMDELLRVDGPALTRWPVRGQTPISYWIQPGAGLADFTPDNRRRVDEAFAAWERSGIPLRFASTSDSAAADIVVLWTPRFDEPISGKTRWMHDRRGWIRNARVTLALHRYTGEQLTGEALHAIALHEVGHSLGLDHTSDIANVMAPRVRVRDLSDADRATARLLYRLPPGLRR